MNRKEFQTIKGQADAAEKRMRARLAVLADEAKTLPPEAIETVKEAAFADYAGRVGFLQAEVTEGIASDRGYWDDMEALERQRTQGALRKMSSGDALAAEAIRGKIHLMTPQQMLNEFRQVVETENTFAATVIASFAEAHPTYPCANSTMASA